MKNLTIKNMPDNLHAELRRRARAHHRNLNGEILSILETTASSDETRHPDAAGILRRVDALRKRMKGHGLTAEEIQATIHRGRP
ncbi:MAG: Arc family DNA-binding protein [Candidatus Hydrogenedentes bacterium]|nr:Arc family DNA-binding protein [Candidatus Hydrogenedentota bacterium]